MNPMMAAKAYAAVQGGAVPTGAASPSPAPGFGEMLQSVMQNTVQSSRAAETEMTSAVRGQGSMIDVVTAVSSAEAQLETVIAVRDQVISAYQEIMRMPL